MQPTRLRALMGAVVVGAVVWFLRPLLLPVVLAIVAGCLLEPIRLRLVRWLPETGATGIVSLLPPLALSCFTASIAAAVYTNWETLTASVGPVERALAARLGTLRRLGLPVPSPRDDSISEALASTFANAGLGFTELMTMITLAQFFLLLGLLERRRWQTKLDALTPRRVHRAIFENLSQRLNDYYATRTVSCVISGLLTATVLFFLDVPGWPVFALLTALMNYIPTVGSWLSAVPAVVVAVGHGGPWVGLAAMFGLFGVEQLVGNLLDPLLQGERIGLSPTVTLFCVVAWGIMWGIPGAFVAVPITLMVLCVMEQSPSLAPYAKFLLASDDALQERVKGGSMSPGD